MYYFKNIQENYLYMVDEKNDFMITIHKNNKSAFIQYSWDKPYINRILDKYMIDDQYRPYYCDIKESDFYKEFNSFQSFKILRNGDLTIEIENSKPTKTK